MITCYLNPAKSNAPRMLTAFAKGSGADITTDLTLRDGLAVLFGVDMVTWPLYSRIVTAGHPHVVIDNGYFRARYTGGDYYRITRNGMQHHGIGESSGCRWSELGIRIKPWRDDGLHILVALQSAEWYLRHHTTVDEWTRATVARIREHTARPIVVRGKPIKGHREPPLETHLQTAWAVVTHSSNVAVDGLLLGVPCFCLHPCAAWAMGSGNLAALESPARPDGRLQWAAVLADNQWTTAEMEAGVAWRALQ